MTDLREKFIIYLPSTFYFDNAHREIHDEGALRNDGGDDDKSHSPSDSIKERVVHFQKTRIAMQEEGGALSEEEVGDNHVAVDEAMGVASNYTLL